MDSRHIGLVVIALGALIVLVGVLIWTGALGWFGRLPGDIRIEGEHTRVYFPLASMLVVSVLLSLLLAAIRRFF